MRHIDPYLDGKLKSNQQTPANKADPKMSVQVSRARTTVMDADYWTVETIREKEGLGEVSVSPRRERPDKGPSHIYEIHVHQGIVGTSIRQYPDTVEGGWVYQFSLGPGSSVAIAFDGHWTRFEKKWRLVTEEKPWIFWVDHHNVLWRQYWDEESTKNPLASHVLKVKALRAWKNVNLPDRDQGIVVAYIKTDGTLWYRNYCQQEEGPVIWESEKALTALTTRPVNLNLCMTNDYRMGFIIEDEEEHIHWLMTTRNWAGMAIEQDQLTTRASGQVDFIRVSYHQTNTEESLTLNASSQVALLFARTDNTITQVENLPITRVDGQGQPYQDWGFLVRVTLSYFAINIPHMVLMDDTTQTSLPIEQIEVVSDGGGFIFQIYIDEIAAEFGMNMVEDSLSLTVSGALNQAGYIHDTMLATFIPENLIHPNIPLPEVEAIWNE